jgi:micrococcal nuclease
MAVPLMAAIGIGAVLAVGGGGVIAYNASAGDTAQVVRVIDGDTFDASLDGSVQRIRLLNVDTPETKDPDKPVECLGPQASDHLASLLHPGDAVTLTYDTERHDRYGRLLAGVEKDDVFINAEIAREGLGVAKVYEPNHRYYDEVLTAQRDAESHRVGLYDPTVDCTLPGIVAAAESGAASSNPTDPGAMDAEAARLNGVADGRTPLIARFDGPRVGPVWDAFTLDQQAALRARAAQGVAAVRASAAEWSRRASDTRAQIEAARVAEENRRVAEATARSQAAAEERRAQDAARAETRRLEDEAAAARRSSSSSSSGSGSSTSSSSSAGYTGPRCYAPGGKTWRPC